MLRASLGGERPASQTPAGCSVCCVCAALVRESERESHRVRESMYTKYELCNRLRFPLISSRNEEIHKQEDNTQQLFIVGVFHMFLLNV